MSTHQKQIAIHSEMHGTRGKWAVHRLHTVCNTLLHICMVLACASRRIIQPLFYCTFAHPSTVTVNVSKPVARHARTQHTAAVQATACLAENADTASGQGAQMIHPLIHASQPSAMLLQCCLRWWQQQLLPPAKSTCLLL